MYIPTLLGLQQISVNSCTGSQKGVNCGVARVLDSQKKKKQPKKHPCEKCTLAISISLQNPIAKWFLKSKTASAVSPAQSGRRTATLGQEPQSPPSPPLCFHQQSLRKGYENRASVE